jgi:hypothetical protein
MTDSWTQLSLALMMEAVCTSETPYTSTTLQCAIFQKAVMFIPAAARTWNLKFWQTDRRSYFDRRGAVLRTRQRKHNKCVKLGIMVKAGPFRSLGTMPWIRHYLRVPLATQQTTDNRQPLFCLYNGAELPSVNFSWNCKGKYTTRTYKCARALYTRNI